MKYFVVSDIHGYYDELIEALQEKGFNKNAKNHCLIVCGDCFDRGPKPIEVMNYLSSLPRRHLIWGNHEQLMAELLNHHFPYTYDISNGTWDTLNKFLEKNEERNPNGSWTVTLTQFYEFFNQFQNYYETKNYIFVHSWIPYFSTPGGKIVFDENWRDEKSNWDAAIWDNPFQIARAGGNKTGKTIVFGHWHCSSGKSLETNRMISEFGEDAIWEPYYGIDENGGRYIAIDRCTAYTKKVNVLVLEDEEI